MYEKLLKLTETKYINKYIKGNQGAIWFKNYKDNKMIILIEDGLGNIVKEILPLQKNIGDIIMQNPNKYVVGNHLVFFGYSKEFDYTVQKLLLKNRKDSNSQLNKLRRKYLDTDFKYIGDKNWNLRINIIEEYLNQVKKEYNIKDIKRNGDEISFKLSKTIFIFGVNYAVCYNNGLKEHVELELFELISTKFSIYSAKRYCQSLKLPEIIPNIVQKYDLRN